MEEKNMADFNEVLEGNKDKLGDLAGSTENFTKLSAKLNELGYDVLLNHKEKAEFIPASRLNDVVSQRDTFKTQVQDLNKQLQTLKDGAKGNEELQGKLQGLLDQNQTLLTELENTKINTELMLAAKDAVNPKDVLVFVNKENLKVNSKGEVMGIEAEITRIKTEKPYLFKTEQQKKKGGSDSSGGDGDSGKLNMNFLIRRAAGK
jgi:hypothetical protein